MGSKLNSHATGFVGIGAAAATLYGLVTNPDYLVALYHAILHIKHHQIDNADLYTFAQALAASIGIGVGLYFGRPLNVAADPK